MPLILGFANGLLLLVGDILKYSTTWLLFGGGGRMHIVYTIILCKMAQLLDGGNIEL